MQNFRGDRLALLENFVRILDALGPADVADVDEAIEAIFDFDERAEFGDVADFAGDDGAERIFFGGEQPWIGQRLLDAERNAAIAGLDVEHDDIDFVADLGDFRRMLDFFVPAHFGNVDEAFDALLEFDEHAVVNDADDLALDFAACGIFFRGADPRIVR